MTDRQTQSDDWIAVWIARQRESLMQAANAPGQNAQGPADMLRAWLAAGQAYFEGLKAKGAAATEGGDQTGFADPFNIGHAMSAAWANAGVFQSGMAHQMADAFGRLPPIGLAREHTEAWRELAAAQAQCQQIEAELRAVVLKVQLDALDLLAQRVRERAASAPIDSFRALYDLWVECGEQVYGKLAHSEAYSKLQAELGNASMRLRARMQTVIEQGLKQYDLPTRSELNSLHRQVRDLRAQLERLAAGSPPSKAQRPKRSAQKHKTKSRRK